MLEQVPMNCSDERPPDNASRPRSTVVGGILNLINTCIGGGTALVALPLAMAKLGVGFGIAMFALFGILVAFSLWLMIEAAEQCRFSDERLDTTTVDVSTNGHSSVETVQLLPCRRPQPFTYNELGRRAFGNSGLTLFNLTVLINNTGMSVLFLDLLADLLPGLLAKMLGIPASRWYISRSFLLFLATVVLFPLLLLKNIEALKYASFIGIAASAVLVGVVLYGSGRSPVGTGTENVDLIFSNPAHPAKTIRNMFVGMPIIVFVYTCHYNVYSIFNGFEVATRKAQMWRVVLVTFTFDFVLYVLVGLSGYFIFRSATEDNIVSQLAGSRVAPTALMDAVQIGFVIGVIFTIPLFNLEARVGFQYVWRQVARACGARVSPPNTDEPEHGPRAISRVFLCETLFLSAVFLSISLVVKDIGVVFGVIGATTATAISYVYPALFFLKVVPPERRSQRLTFAVKGLMIFGIVSGTVSLFQAISDLVS